MSKPLMSKPAPSPCTIAVALTTAPLLAGLLAAKAISDTLVNLGQASEEVFRGDRLPVLTIPANQSTPAPHAS